MSGGSRKDAPCPDPTPIAVIPDVTTSRLPPGSPDLDAKSPVPVLGGADRGFAGTASSPPKSSDRPGTPPHVVKEVAPSVEGMAGATDPPLPRQPSRQRREGARRQSERLDYLRESGRDRSGEASGSRTLARLSVASKNGGEFPFSS
jgi:hypothetical protein